MKRDINVSFSKTINTGNYESSKVGVNYGRELSEDEDEVEAIKEEFKLVKNLVTKFANRIERD